MAFLLRSISRSADGREIVRTSKISDDLLKVGRDPECDIRLNDLAVALHHATIEQVSATRVGVSAEMGMSIELDGSNTQFGQIDLAIGGTVKIGPFLLRIMPPELGGEDVPIVIQRADADAVTDKFDTRRFALQSVMPGKRPMAWTLTLLVLAIFLVWPIVSFYQNRDQADRMAGGFHADSLWSTGALSQSHAALGSNCQACHVRPFEPVQRRRLQGLPRQHPRPCRSRADAARDAAARRPPARPAIDRQRCSARPRAAASNAIPSMRGRRRWCRRRSNSAPIAIPTCARGCPTRGSAAPSDFERRPSRIPAGRADPVERRRSRTSSGWR